MPLLHATTHIASNAQQQEKKEQDEEIMLMQTGSHTFCLEPYVAALD